MLFIVVRVISVIYYSLQRVYARASLVGLLLLLGIGLSGCSSFSMSSLPTFGFGGGDNSHTPDCSEIEKRMVYAHHEYAQALSREKPAVYLTFTGNLSKTMRRYHLRGVHEMTDRHLDKIVDHTQQACMTRNLARSVCLGADRLGAAYKPLVLTAREAYENYCGNRRIR